MKKILIIIFCLNIISISFAIAPVSKASKIFSITIYRSIPFSDVQRFEEKGFTEIPTHGIQKRIQESRFVWEDDMAIHNGRIPFSGILGKAVYMKIYQGSKRKLISIEIPYDLFSNPDILLLKHDAKVFLDVISKEFPISYDELRKRLSDPNSQETKRLNEIVKIHSDKNKKYLKQIKNDANSVRLFFETLDEIIIPAEILKPFEKSVSDLVLSPKKENELIDAYIEMMLQPVKPADLIYEAA